MQDSLQDEDDLAGYKVLEDQPNRCTKMFKTYLYMWDDFPSLKLTGSFSKDKAFDTAGYLEAPSI